MKDHGECKRGFFHISQSPCADGKRWRNGEVDEITIGFYDGGTTGEFCITWVTLAGRTVPQLRVYDDAWSALAGFKDVLDALAEIDGTSPSPEEVKALLRKCGVVDMTNG